LFKVSMVSSFAIVLAILLALVLIPKHDAAVPLILSVVSKSGPRGTDDAALQAPLYTAPNAFAEEDAELLKKWFGGAPDRPRQNVLLAGDFAKSTGPQAHKTSQLITALTQPLKDEDLRPGGPNNDMIAMFLSAHGFVDHGKAFLAVGDSRVDRPDTWVAFDDLFAQVVKALDVRPDGEKVRLLMFIDAARVGPQWDWGQFSESFARACSDVVEAESNRVAVILSASPNQRSLSDPRRGNSLFVQSIIESLTGRGDLDDNGVVTVEEISRYLRRQVPLLASTTWDATQMPMLIGEDAKSWEFINQPVIRSEGEVNENRVDSKVLQDKFAAVDALWERHNALQEKTHPPLAFDPLGWSVLEKKLARLDATLLAGTGYLSDFSSLKNECETLLLRYEKGPGNLPPQSYLPELALRDYFYDDAPTTPEFDEMVAAWEQKPSVEAVQIPLTEFSATQFLWDWLERTEFRRDAMKQADALLSAKGFLGPGRTPQLLETFLVHLLTAEDLSHVDQQSMSLIADSQRLARQTLFAKDLRASFWLRDRFAALNAERLSCIDRVLSRNSNQIANGLDRWRRITNEAFTDLNDRGDKLSAAYRLRDQMLHTVPRMAATLMHDLEAFEDLERLPANRTHLIVEAAINRLASLVEALQLPRDGEIRPIEAVERQVLKTFTDADQAYRSLVQRISDRCDQATVQKAGDARGLRQTVALMFGSGTSNAVQRRRVHTEYCNLVSQPPPPVGIALPAANTNQTDEAPTTWLTATLVDNRHVWDYWLRAALGIVTPEDQTDQATEPLEQADSETAPFAAESQLLTVGDSIRESLQSLAAGNLAEQTTPQDVLESPLQLAEQRASLPQIRRELERWDTFLRGRTILFSHAPDPLHTIGTGRFALDQQLFLFDHASRCLDEFWCNARPEEPRFFASATSRLIDSRRLNPLFRDLLPTLDGTDLVARQAEADSAAEDLTTLQPLPVAEYRGGALLRFVAGEEVGFDLKLPASLPEGFLSLWATRNEQSDAVPISGNDSEPLTIPVRIPENISGEENEFCLSTFYRGLRRAGCLDFRKFSQGDRMVYVLPKYAAPKAYVSRQQEQPERIMLILDCSLSMNNAEGARTRFDVATAALNGFLNGLNQDVEVGLILFGSQYSFQTALGQKPETTSGGTKLKTYRLQNGIPQRLRDIAPDEDVDFNPNFDVSQVNEVKPLTQTHLNDIQQQLQQANAFGVTPTHRAISAAVDRLGNQGGHIIVLTDGNPFVIGGQAKLAPVDDRKQIATEKIASRKEIKLTIVKYRAGKTSLANDYPKANIVEARNGDELLRYLNQSRVRPVVQWERDRVEASSEGDFESTVELAQWPPRGVNVLPGQPVSPAVPFDIRATVSQADKQRDERAPVRVQGGERFELLLTPTDLKLAPFSFAAQDWQRMNLKLADKNRFQAFAGVAGRRINRQLTVRLGIESAVNQQATGSFTPRPSDLWVELRAGGSGADRPTYEFSLPEFEINKSIPIVLCRIDDFPDGVDVLELKAWLRFGETTLPGVSLPLDHDGPIRRDELPGVTFRIERGLDEQNQPSVTVTEEYAEDRPFGQLRVLSRPLPERAATEMDRKNRVIVRQFHFAQSTTSISLSAIEADKIRENSSLNVEGRIRINLTNQ
jgi:hypothetical protein